MNGMNNHWTPDQPIGRVLRASTSGFSAGTRISHIEQPEFGMLVRAQPQNGSTREPIYGLLYNIHIDDDPMIRQLVLADSVSEETINDQHHHRLVPVEMSVLAVGFRAYDGSLRHALPPRPPLSLDPVFLCTADEVQELATRFDYFRVVLSSSQVPSEQLVAANLLLAAQTLPAHEQYPFLVSAGRELARLLSNDMARLDHLLRLIYPGEPA
ncbi:MAG: hypothetical protein GYB68_11485 [Chloroflexi bacterium]|nr:hypothetical protein [Chloroflexota bacterium]